MKFTQYNRNKHKAGKIYLNPRHDLLDTLQWCQGCGLCKILFKGFPHYCENCDKSLKWTQALADYQKKYQSEYSDYSVHCIDYTKNLYQVISDFP